MQNSPNNASAVDPQLQQISGQDRFQEGSELDKVLREILEAGEESILERVNERLLRLAFLGNGQNQVRTAKALGVSRNSLRTCLKRHGMIR